MEEALKSSDPISIASQRGDTQVVADLISQGYSPNMNTNYALYIATARGYQDIIDLLLRTGKVNPSDGKDSALLNAVVENNISSIKKFLKYSQADPTAENNQAIIEACSRGFVGMMNLLLADANVDPSARDNECLIQAASRGYIDIVSSLLKESSVDPRARQSRAIILAASEKQLEVVQLLLKDGRSELHTRDNSLLRSSDKNEWRDISRLVASNLRVDPLEGSSWSSRRDIIISRVKDPLLGLVMGYRYAGGPRMRDIKKLFSTGDRPLDELIHHLLTRRSSVKERIEQEGDIAGSFQLLEQGLSFMETLETLRDQGYDSELIEVGKCLGAQLGGSELMKQGLILEPIEGQRVEHLLMNDLESLILV